MTEVLEDGLCSLVASYQFYKIIDILQVTTCFAIASSTLNNSSNPLFLTCSNKAVAIFICVSRVALRAVNSGKAVIAVLRWAALALGSL